MSSKTKKHRPKHLSGTQERRGVHWTSRPISTELSQKMRKKLKKSHSADKMATTQTASLMTLCQIVKPATREGSRLLSP